MGDIVEFPHNRQEPEPEPELWSDDGEDWEVDVDLLQSKQYEELLRYRKERLRKDPHDHYRLCEVGEAYILNGSYQDAIQFLSPLHKRYPDRRDFQHLILDALFAQGKTERDFHWASPPVVLRLADGIVDECYAYLRPKRKPRCVSELRARFCLRGYSAFSDEDLLRALVSDGRFVVDDPSSFSFAEVTVQRVTRR